MRRALIVLTSLAVSVLAEPPVPQGQYGAPSGQSGGLSSQYGAPGGSSSGGYSSGGGYPGSSGSGFGSGQYAGGDEPMFTHEQDFQQSPGVIWGKWSVVLPDGRTQKVEYDADENGFHPIITYEEPEGSQGGYSNGGSGGYSSGGYSRGGNGGFGSGGSGGYSSGGNGGFGSGSHKSGGSRNGGYSGGSSSGGRGGYNY
uniref:Uncharacterized protein n=1 Tax=Graphocephala atropunctata TaxID=36148 RepID=A0A1B6MGZ5_9HEMI